MFRFPFGLVVAFAVACLVEVSSAQICETAADGSSCSPPACSLVPEDFCLPDAIHLDINTGALRYDDCQCLDFNTCHIEFGNASPFPSGFCPDGQSCAVVSKDTDDDGVPDTFSATCDGPCCDPNLEPGSGNNAPCIEGHTCCADGLWRCNQGDGTPTCEGGHVCPVGSCCLDIDDGPVPYDTCLTLTRKRCAEKGGLFHLTSNAACEPTQACCIPSSPLGPNLCVDLHPTCCKASGGSPLGAGSSCHPAAIVCGGIAGFPCPPDYECVDDPSDNCDPDGGGADCIGICRPPALCGDALGIKCPGGYACVSSSTQPCDPNDPSVVCVGTCEWEAVCPGKQACLSDADCSALTQFCLFAQGSCGTAGDVGWCADRPQGCPDVWNPVCGCDGETYGNACDAHAAGINVQHKGTCKPAHACCLDFDDGPVPFDTCLAMELESCLAEGGVPAGSNISCERTEACCLSTFGERRCADLHPLCCVLSGGVPQGADSSCRKVTVPDSCGGFAGLPCPDGYDCVDDPDDNCDPADAADCPGVCAPQSIACKSADGTSCPPGFTCVDNPFSGCKAGDPNCLGVCAPVPPPCGRVCGGIIGIPCENPDEFCKLPDGACCCDHFGVCSMIPDACFDVWDPVCGCDGMTYGNECEADAAGVSVDHRGECRVHCVDDADCESDQYCRNPDGTCGTANVPGLCMDRPAACPEIYDPVCGCDYNTYGNECEAAAAGVSILHDGPCAVACKVNCAESVLSAHFG
jgi:hypothetical protein